jgi:hypothetical protein
MHQPTYQSDAFYYRALAPFTELSAANSAGLEIAAPGKFIPASTGDKTDR